MMTLGRKLATESPRRKSTCLHIPLCGVMCYAPVGWHGCGKIPPRKTCFTCFPNLKIVDGKFKMTACTQLIGNVLRHKRKLKTQLIFWQRFAHVKLAASLIGACGCRKKGNHCGPGCSCQRCKNVPISGTTDKQIQEQLSSDSASQSEDDSSTTESSEHSDDEDEDSSIIIDVVTDALDKYVVDMPF